ncbi:MBL fold metallo-hydrolase [Hydrogenophaga sp. UC242_50]|jgi:cyclase|uniref:MBL fold metallo-hydrolase n=1 Tax=unclassified Hydrogenophaga TaxID=2610897 RepID=UPI0036D2A087
MKWQYTKGLHDIGNGNYAWLLPDGTWGWSNAGLVTDSGESLLVDTLFDLKLTREMLHAMRNAVPEAKEIAQVVNTHANGDHYFGNQLVADSEIIVSQACADEMLAHPPQALIDRFRNYKELGDGGEFLMKAMGRVFDFRGIVYTPPTKTFSGEIDLKVGNKTVKLVEVGPAHTKGDVLAYIPEDKIVYTGDILFNGGHPIVWAGPVDNWIRACDLMLGWDVDVVVPGHGPITDKTGVRALKHYLEYVKAEARKRYDQGMTLEQAVDDISLREFNSWTDAERIYVTVNNLYQEFSGDTSPPDTVKLFGLMAHYEERQRKLHGNVIGCGPNCNHANH